MPSPRHALVPASYVYLVRGRSILLQQRANTGYMDGHWVAGAAGHVESGETALEAAVREVREEIGVSVEPTDLTLVTVMHRTDGSDNPLEQRIDWFWAATRWSGVPHIREPHKCVALEWHDLDSLPEPIPAYERMVLDGLESGIAPTTTFGFEVR